MRAAYRLKHYESSANMKTALSVLFVLLPLVAALPWHWNYATADQQTPAPSSLPVSTADSACKSVAVDCAADGTEYFHLCLLAGHEEACSISEMQRCCVNGSYPELYSAAVELNTTAYNVLIYRTASGICNGLAPAVNACVTVDAPNPEPCVDTVHPCTDCHSQGSNGTCSDDGQCSCFPGYTGRTCETCDDGYYSSDGECNLCVLCCDVGAAETCSNGTGECLCKVGFTGANCCSCEDGYIDNGEGCEKKEDECLCCEENSASGCGGETGGVCICKPGSVGDDCCQCDIGYSKAASGVCQQELNPELQSKVDSDTRIDKEALENEIMAAVEAVLLHHGNEAN